MYLSSKHALTVAAGLAVALIGGAANAQTKTITAGLSTPLSTGGPVNAMFVKFAAVGRMMPGVLECFESGTCLGDIEIIEMVQLAF